MSDVRQKALNLIELAQHPRRVAISGGNWAKEDTASANREAQLALAAAMVYLADALRQDQGLAIHSALEDGVL